jgi:hypothetical protein
MKVGIRESAIITDPSGVSHLDLSIYIYGDDADKPWEQHEFTEMDYAKLLKDLREEKKDIKIDYKYPIVKILGSDKYDKLNKEFQEGKLEIKVEKNDKDV